MTNTLPDHSFSFNGLNSRTNFNFFVSGGGTHNAPERDIEGVPVPGRNGELTIDHGRFKNISVTYSGWIVEDAKENLIRARNWLTSAIGYKKLEDAYYRDYYRMARLVGGIEFTLTNTYPQAAIASVRFDCMPQRWLNSGDDPIEIQSSGQAITNPTKFPAYPLITINGTGKVKLVICGKDLYISNIGGTMYIDCDIERAYSIENDVLVPMDNRITVPDGYPYIKAPQDMQNQNGTFHVYYYLYENATLTSLTLTPRWWEI